MEPHKAQKRSLFVNLLSNNQLKSTFIRQSAKLQCCTHDEQGIGHGNNAVVVKVGNADIAVKQLQRNTGNLESIGNAQHAVTVHVTGHSSRRLGSRLGSRLWSRFWSRFISGSAYTGYDKILNYAAEIGVPALEDISFMLGMNGGDCGLTVFNLLDGDKVSESSFFTFFCNFVD